MAYFDESAVWGDAEERHKLLEDFWADLIAIAGIRGGRHAHRKPHGQPVLTCGSGLPGVFWVYSIFPDVAAVSVYIDHASSEGNDLIIDALFSRRDECERIFGAPLIWECLENRPANRIRYEIDLGGFRTPVEQWPELQFEMVSRMEALVAAIGPRLPRITD